MEFLLNLHSGLRWLVVVFALFAAVWFLLTWLGSIKNPKTDRILMSIFTGLVDLQVLIGVIYLIWSGIQGAGFPGYRIEHGVTMLIAAVVGHVSMAWRKAEAPKRSRNNLLLLVVVLTIIFIGVAPLPQGWHLG